MVELYFLLYRIPQMMTRLARERNRSAFTWSLIGIGAWIGAEFVVMFGAGLIYGTGTALLGWPEKIPAGLQLLFYLLALGAAITSVTLVRRFLRNQSDEKFVPLPPPPPMF
jgi:hypothetical protein